MCFSRFYFTDDEGRILQYSKLSSGIKSFVYKYDVIFIFVYTVIFVYTAFKCIVTCMHVHFNIMHGPLRDPYSAARSAVLYHIVQEHW